MAPSPPNLFFAGSDEEGEHVPRILVDEDASHESELIPPSDPQTPAKSPVSSNLFFAASDEEEVEEALVSSFHSVYKSRVTGDDDVVLPVSTPDAAPSQASTPPAIAGEGLEQPPCKKRRLSPAAEIRLHSSSQSLPIYLGDILVDGAWCTVSGKGYVKTGESVLVRRDKPDDEASGSKAQRGKNSNQPKRTGGKKQISITSMLTRRTSKPAKKKVDTVVRILNNRGFGIVNRWSCCSWSSHCSSDFARLPTEIASWISKLLDFGAFYYP